MVNFYICRGTVVILTLHIGRKTDVRLTRYIHVGRLLSDLNMSLLGSNLGVHGQKLLGSTLCGSVCVCVCYCKVLCILT